MLRDAVVMPQVAMFISDLHLDPKQPKITQKFLNFCTWVKGKTQSLYILGDFLHAWPGDDALDSWSINIVNALADLGDCGIKVYFLPGNRDFLIGKKFLKLAKVQKLPETCIMNLGLKKVLLVHGDSYCTQDKAHQILRRFTRNLVFKTLFLLLPFSFRCKIVNKIRQYSANNKLLVKLCAESDVQGDEVQKSAVYKQVHEDLSTKSTQKFAPREGFIKKSYKPKQNMLTDATAISRQLRKYNLDTVIHGHIHVAGLTCHQDSYGNFFQYVLSDWDASPEILCYNYSIGFSYKLLGGDEIV